MLKRLVLLGSLLFFGFTVQNDNPPFTAQLITQVDQQVRQWIFAPPNDDAPLNYFTLTDDKLLINKDAETVELPLPPHFYRLKTSAESHCFALIELLPASKEHTSARLAIKVYATPQTLLFSVEEPLLNPESIPSVTVLDNGALILSEAPIGRLAFYSTSGRLLRELQLFDDASYDLERVLMVAPAAADANRIAVLASKRGSAPLDSDAPRPTGEPHLFMFDYQGNLMWQQALPEAAPSNIAFSPDGEHLLVSVHSAYLFKPIVKKTLLVTADGALQKTFSFLFKQIDFARAQKRALLADRFTVRQINLQNGELEWEHHFLPEKGLVAAVKLDENGQKAAVLTALHRFYNHRFEFHAPTLHAFDQQGKLLKKVVFEGEKFLTPALQFKQNEIYTGFIQNLYKTEVQ
ncbi:hypothetical protein Calab_0271 [Caldithrix abyssi DSM 13497]|uniref:Uncharacterized protein n=1 Tax=Caldithrix abyssi DSM 13497 TaxID=880073 RepID=H1XNX9_CALAY|nr:hypothetical protein [Caldithrix abyssi]APF19820.1 hypothetical protein Cabys_3072 [Caldithrix abyssi DSM 13497]EHO39919.1 hypothetical protein Calab_0271 [Caldithrix abyssi DSM 13497]